MIIILVSIFVIISIIILIILWYMRYITNNSPSISWNKYDKCISLSNYDKDKFDECMSWDKIDKLYSKIMKILKF